MLMIMTVELKEGMISTDQRALFLYRLVRLISDLFRVDQKPFVEL